MHSSKIRGIFYDSWSDNSWPRMCFSSQEELISTLKYSMGNGIQVGMLVGQNKNRTILFRKRKYKYNVRYKDTIWRKSREPPDEIPEIKMAGPTRVVLLACGSYNPVTNMHLRMFELARDTLQRSGKYKVIGGIISPVNDAYKKKDLIVAKHRIAMLKLALKSSDWIKLDTWESEQDCWLETKKVLDHHKANLDTIINANITENTIVSPSKRRRTTRGRKVRGSDDVDYTIPENLNLNNLEGGPIQLRLLCGADLLESFAVPGLWKDDDIEDIVCKYGLVCITRGGSSPEKFIYEHDVLTKHQHNIVICNEWITNEVSATKIRRSLRRRESVKYLMQDSVISYIREHGLYSTAPSSDK